MPSWWLVLCTFSQTMVMSYMVLTCPHFLHGDVNKRSSQLSPAPRPAKSVLLPHYTPPTHLPAQLRTSSTLFLTALRCAATHCTALHLDCCIARFALHCTDLHYLPRGAGCLGDLADAQTVKWRLEDLAHDVDHKHNEFYTIVRSLKKKTLCCILKC